MLKNIIKLRYLTINSLMLPSLFAMLMLLPLLALAINYPNFESSVVSRFGPERVPLLRAWQGVLNNFRNLAPQEKSRVINDFFNQNLVWQEDTVVWGQSEYWATPGETFGRASGDCEDFSIAKYFSLKELLVPNNMLRMVYVKANQNGQLIAHMVLAYYPFPNAEPFILDNLNFQMLPASQRNDLSPIYSFNSDGVWQGTSSATQSGRISRWQDLLQRARAEGFF